MDDLANCNLQTEVLPWLVGYETPSVSFVEVPHNGMTCKCYGTNDQAVTNCNYISIVFENKANIYFKDRSTRKWAVNLRPTSTSSTTICASILLSSSSVTQASAWIHSSPNSTATLCRIKCICKYKIGNIICSYNTNQSLHYYNIAFWNNTTPFTLKYSVKLIAE